MPVTMQRRSRMHEAVLQRGFSLQSAPQKAMQPVGAQGLWQHRGSQATSTWFVIDVQR